MPKPFFDVFGIDFHRSATPKASYNEDLGQSVPKSSDTIVGFRRRINDGFVRPYLDEGYEGPRQALEQPYAPNGASYLIDRGVLTRDRTFFPDRTIGFAMMPERSANIDSPEDWRI